MKFSKLFIFPVLLCALALAACSNPKAEAETVGDKPAQETAKPDAAEQARIDQMIKAIQAEEARMKAAGETK